MIMLLNLELYLIVLLVVMENQASGGEEGESHSFY